MTIARRLPVLLALLLTAAAATAQENLWVSYRDAYRAMVVFDKYGKPKNYLQQHVQVMARHQDASLDGVALTLKGKTLNVNLPLDATGRAVFPLLKAAYDDNAALVLNRAPGQFVFRRRVSIAVRTDGMYDSAELRTACEQALAFARHVEAGAAARQCAGVRFAFAPRGLAPDVRLRTRAGAVTALAALDGPAFSDDPHGDFRVVTYRFGEAGQVLMQGVPVVIAPLFE